MLLQRVALACLASASIHGLLLEGEKTDFQHCRNKFSNIYLKGKCCLLDSYALLRISLQGAQLKNPRLIALISSKWKRRLLSNYN